ncbi:adenylosuccinate lyase family protein [Phaeobacter inhibens]|uniref:lyase family protein n=1 Tax=Phaeobacter inhibens TaxID=221822 RepID=UPI0021A949FC|nr:lyase family protein [Phaeobacter inhibens]UWR80747.1 adenylosuccinate lyase family protein [Phaeobacter inhibens]UWS08508.1 adenylosuccinate lyase family protein [Phaeobacter inhibens]
MAASLFDSQLYASLFSAGDISRLFSDSAEIRAMLLVEGALAKAQGKLGLIPEDSAAAIGRAVMEVALDPGALTQAAGQNGVPVPGLVSALRDEMNAPEHAQYVHWGATSQDIMDSALMLRLRQALAAVETDLLTLLTQLSDMADTHANLPMAARTYGQLATPTSFGAVVAAWGQPLAALLEELPTLRQTCLLVSLSGAAGTSSALGPKASELRAELAAGLSLVDPHRSWHTDRSPVLRIADWLTRACTSLSKLGTDCLALRQSGIDELTTITAGASSTMPQKQNPVAASALIALASQATAQLSALNHAAAHQHQRDGASWFGEWLSLPQIVFCAASAARTAVSMTKGLAPDAKQMLRNLHAANGTIYAEALSFALAEQMRRGDAQTAVKDLCAKAAQEGVPLQEVATAQFPELDQATIFDATRQLGSAPEEAQRFVRTVAALKGRKEST